ncbi:MAG: nuclear transport factor 2 family protein [Pseudomonadota bacterium]
MGIGEKSSQTPQSESDSWLEMENEILDRLGALEDREAIRDVLYKYCQAVDRGDRELMLSCYHPNATDDHGFFAGPATDFIDYVLPQLAKLEHSVHSLSNPQIQLDGNFAHTQTQWSVIHRVKRRTSMTDFWHQGRYLDVFEKRNGDWKILKRIAVIDGDRWVKTANLYHLLKKSEREAFDFGERGEKDPIYNVEHLQARSKHIEGPKAFWSPLKRAVAIPVFILHWLGGLGRDKD